MYTGIEPNKFKVLVRLEALKRDTKAPLNIADAVSDIFVDREKTTSDDVGLAIAIAQHVIHEHGTARKKETRRALANLVLGLTTPEAVLSGRQREDAVRPDVEQLRRHYFGATTVPFTSYEIAVEWLRQQAVVSQKLTSNDPLMLVFEAMEQCPKHYHLDLAIGWHIIPLLPLKPGARKRTVTFDQESALENLKKVTERMSGGTGCDVALCVAHVLTGAPLILRPLDWCIEISHGCRLVRHSATITILQPHAITLAVLTQAYSVLREALGLTKQKTMAAWHERLLQLVKEKGGVPMREKAKFWEVIRRAWNKSVPTGGRPYETWRGPLMAYRRLHKTLKKRSSMGALRPPHH